jgi:mannose PTS system EIIA component
VAAAITGVVIVTHGKHGAEMLNEAQSIVGKIPQSAVVTVVNKEPVDAVNANLEAACYTMDQGAGVLFLVDLHGSTPANLCLNLMDGTHDVEVLCGRNMAMLIKLATCERKDGPQELAELLKATGRRSIRLGSEITGRIQVDKVE